MTAIDQASSGPRFPHVNVRMVGEDGNAFAIIGRVRRALTRAGLHDEAKAFAAEAMACGSYDDLLVLVLRTVEVDAPEGEEEAEPD